MNRLSEIENFLGALPLTKWVALSGQPLWKNTSKHVLGLTSLPKRLENLLKKKSTFRRPDPEGSG